MAFGAPDDDDQQPDQLTALLAGMRGSADDQAAATQTSGTAQPTPAAAATGQPTGTSQQAQTSTVAAPQPQGATSAPAIVLPTAPQAPTLDQAKYQQLEDQVHQYAQPINRNDAAVKPKWYDRLAGGLVGFGEGYSGNVAGGIRDGGRITTHRYDEAEADQQKKEQGAQQDLSSFEHQYDLSRKGYEDQVTNFGAQMQAANAQREQGNADRQFQFTKDNTQREQSNADRDYNRASGNDTFEHSRQTSEDTETARHNKATEGVEGSRVKMERDRLNFDENGGATTPQSGAMKAYQGLLSTRDKEYAAAQKQKDAELKEADIDGDPQRKAAVEGKWNDWAAGKQKEWNQRLSAADPDGKIAAVMNRQPAPQGGAQPQQAAQSGVQQTGKGKVVSLAKAMGLPANKGKTADQVRADITARGYQVGE